MTARYTLIPTKTADHITSTVQFTPRQITRGNDAGKWIVSMKNETGDTLPGIMHIFDTQETALEAIEFLRMALYALSGR